MKTSHRGRHTGIRFRRPICVETRARALERRANRFHTAPSISSAISRAGCLGSTEGGTPSRQPAGCQRHFQGKFPCVPLRPLWLDKALMKYCRFEHNGGEQYGLVESVAGREEITRLLVTAPEEIGDIEDLRTKRIDPISLAEASLLPPVRPSKIVCVGRNYREHAA